MRSPAAGTAFGRGRVQSAGPQAGGGADAAIEGRRSCASFAWPAWV